VVAPLFGHLLGGPVPSPCEVLDRAKVALGVYDYEQASRLAHEIADNPDEHTHLLRAEALTIIATAERRAGSRFRAMECIEEALRLHPTLVDARREYGLVLLWLGRMADADAVLSALCSEAPADARAWLRLGYARMWTATIAAADDCFSRAHALDAEVIVPFRTDERDFDTRVILEWEAIPLDIRSHVDRKGIEVRTAPLPTAEAVRAGEHPLLRGYCDHMTRSIVLFHRMVELGCPDSDSVQAQVRRVVRHEVGHALGMGEEEVAALGL
jgi:tetratricopeptide (TPR) repeat protein